MNHEFDNFGESVFGFIAKGALIFTTFKVGESLSIVALNWTMAISFIGLAAYYFWKSRITYYDYISRKRKHDDDEEIERNKKKET